MRAAAAGRAPARPGRPAAAAGSGSAFLAALPARSYLAVSLVVMAAACRAVPSPLVPAAFAPVAAESFAALAARTVPATPQLIRVHWRYDDGNHEATGRGAVRLAPPDSLRLDVAVPVVGRATLVLAGATVWAEPESIAEEVPQSRPLQWARFGIIRPPDAGTRIEAGEAKGRRVFRLTAPDGRVALLECRGDTLLGGTELEAGKVIGHLALVRDAAGAVVKADARDYQHGARFVVEVDHRETSEPFPAEVWRRP